MLATKSNSYTFQKDGVWYFSRRVPTDLRRHYRTGRIARYICFVFLLTCGLTTPAKANTVSDAQQILNQLGYNAGSVDGAYGSKTRRALEQFYKDAGSLYDGELDTNEVNDLQNA